VPVPTPVQVRLPAVIALKPAVTRPLAPPTIAPPPEIASARPAAPVIELKPIPSPVRTEVFAQANVPPAGTTPGVRPIQAGGFDLPSGSNHGGPGGTAKGVATGGFGDSAGAGNGIARASGGAQIHAAGFGDYNGPVVSPAGLKTASVKPAVTPVEITWKPQPAYTAEARERKLEGEVQLDVLFGAAGHIHVLRVVRGLGSGLDESATTAAEQIRFRPGTRDGSPVDMTGIVHIVFKLS
jgi:TonB family protein